MAAAVLVRVVCRAAIHTFVRVVAVAWWFMVTTPGW